MSDNYVKEETLDKMQDHLVNVRKEFDIAYAFCELRERLKIASTRTPTKNGE